MSDAAVGSRQTTQDPLAQYQKAVQTRDELSRLILENTQAFHAADAIIAAGYRKQPTIDDAMVERAARALHTAGPIPVAPWEELRPIVRGNKMRFARAALTAALEEQP